MRDPKANRKKPNAAAAVINAGFVPAKGDINTTKEARFMSIFTNSSAGRTRALNSVVENDNAKRVAKVEPKPATMVSQTIRNGLISTEPV